MSCDKLRPWPVCMTHCQPLLRLGAAWQGPALHDSKRDCLTLEFAEGDLNSQQDFMWCSGRFDPDIEPELFPDWPPERRHKWTEDREVYFRQLAGTPRSGRAVVMALQCSKCTLKACAWPLDDLLHAPQ
jgi:hypothetical protein